jgi:hypothetical protein
MGGTRGGERSRLSDKTEEDCDEDDEGASEDWSRKTLRRRVRTAWRSERELRGERDWRRG